MAIVTIHTVVGCLWVSACYTSEWGSFTEGPVAPEEEARAWDRLYMAGADLGSSSPGGQIVRVGMRMHSALPPSSAALMISLFLVSFCTFPNWTDEQRGAG